MEAFTMRKLAALLALLATVAALTGCSQDPEAADPDTRNGPTMTSNESETREPTCISHGYPLVYDHENSITVIMDYFRPIHEDLSPEALRDRAERILFMMTSFALMNGIARIEEIEPRVLALRRFLVESETGQICRMIMGPRAWEVEAIVDPATGRTIFGIIE